MEFKCLTSLQLLKVFLMLVKLEKLGQVANNIARQMLRFHLKPILWSISIPYQPIAIGCETC
jgi:hypothetical protein